MSHRAEENTPLLHEHEWATASTPAIDASLLAVDTVSRHDAPQSSISSQQDIEHVGVGIDCPASGLTQSSSSFIHVISVLLIGVFIANADTSLLLATHSIIASEFNALDDSSWLLTSFALAQAATLPLYGKLSDIYGRKVLLLIAYILFVIGLILVGTGSSMKYLILGRVISGAGASGMTALVSVLIADWVSLREVATWRSYVNVVAATGRSIGGPLGGWLADTVGWRWSFTGQAPFIAIAAILMFTVLPSDSMHLPHQTSVNKLARIDFLGCILMISTILAFLLPMEIGGSKIPWSHPAILGLIVAGLVLGSLFIASQVYLAREPVVPLELLNNRDVVGSIAVMFWQNFAQTAVMFIVPMYFQVTQRASNTLAGTHLTPAVVGNATGGIVAGVIIKRTGRYKSLAIAATIGASIGYFLLLLRWRGHTNWLESMYIVPGGFGSGMAQSALFISIQAATEPENIAVAATALYLSVSVGFIAATASAAALVAGMAQKTLERKLDLSGITDKDKAMIVQKAMSDIDFIDQTEPRISRLIVSSYTEAFTWSYGLSLSASLLALLLTLVIKQYRL